MLRFVILLVVSPGTLETSTDFELFEFNNILASLERTYGNDWVKPTNKDGIILNGAIWDGKKVRLELIRMDFSKSYSNPKDYGFISGYINVYDKNLTTAMYASDY
ncbi:hypothetical protein [Chryseobacterium taklimakanense]|uniref:Uncharacterized protein n=1 Tax=Chryseobacterium taklimakanense TaxID=536441 RepID=A0A3G8WY11_9FLAO|nr:hypothetical protein [Chryseobacterium taklimakanense]AZI20656.1 hypothetical protein EIH08_07965 [Chryseobacterium taklimakanense]